MNLSWVWAVVVGLLIVCFFVALMVRPELARYMVELARIAAPVVRELLTPTGYTVALAVVAGVVLILRAWLQGNGPP